jgi:hypothetical protein
MHTYSTDLYGPGLYTTIALNGTLPGLHHYKMWWRHKGTIGIVVKKIKVKRQPPAEFPKAILEIRVG